MSQTVAQVSEFELIAKMVSDLTVGPEVALGPGDDAAVVSIDQGLVISTDVMNEGVHFRQDWVSPIDVGHRCIGGALADIEAMGAMPTAVTIAL
ncbi:MAG: thiamine-phosphate kinase, partial [Propionibacteriaceae bacterium]|nr:thiamine-phosphate kinase [Propionibacteriaceae bacterium]